MIENKYKTKRIIDGKSPLRTVVVDETGKIVNKNPSKEELKGLKNEPRKSHDTILGKRRKYTDEELLYYFLVLNEDFTKLKYVWRVPGEVVEKDYFFIGHRYRYEFNIENMKEYDITEKFNFEIL